MEKLILHLIGQYEDVTDGGGVGASMLAHWLGVTRQGANWHLRRMFKDKLITRKNIGNRGHVPTFRYFLAEKTREFYEDGKFKNEYFEKVYTSEVVEHYDKMCMQICGE